VRLYAESSAVLSWLLGEPQGEEVKRQLAAAEAVLTSVLTPVEVERVLIRAQITEGLNEGEIIDRRRTLAQAGRHWHQIHLHEEILDRARRPFPGEPIRTLDALHLASALLAREAVPEIAILSLDTVIRATGGQLGFALLPAV
jgi:hypothetical protein